MKKLREHYSCSLTELIKKRVDEKEKKKKKKKKDVSLIRTSVELRMPRARIATLKSNLVHAMQFSLMLVASHLIHLAFLEIVSRVLHFLPFSGKDREDVQTD